MIWPPDNLFIGTTLTVELTQLMMTEPKDYRDRPSDSIEMTFVLREKPVANRSSRKRGAQTNCAMCGYVQHGMLVVRLSLL